MQSTRSRVADTVEQYRDDLARGMVVWLSVDGSLDLPQETLKALCRGVLRDLRSWLRSHHDAPQCHARVLLQSDRVAALACRYVAEFCKSEGLFDDLPRDRRGEAMSALDAFFHDNSEPQAGGCEARRDRSSQDCVPGSSHPANLKGTGA